MQKKHHTAPVNKVMSLKQAVAQFVQDGAYLSFGGIGDRTQLQQYMR